MALIEYFFALILPRKVLYDILYVAVNLNCFKVLLQMKLELFMALSLEVDIS